MNQPKQRFGKFEVGELLGQGGFGRVFHAYDPMLKREVAIKTCTLQDPAMRKRFLREAEIAAGLRHPNIGVIYDLGEHEGEPYIVQEFLPGEDLSDVIKRRDALPLDVKVRFLVQVAEALAFAHSKGVIHRDIKPQNIRVLTNGEIRVLDFGIAKRSLEETGTALTRTGVGMGTVGYISPEQLMGEKVDHRTDIFSFGALAFEALTCEKPFSGDSLQSVFYKIMNVDPVWPAALPDHLPPVLRALVERCMAKRPDDRPQTCGEIARALSAIATVIAEDGVSGDTTKIWVGPDPVAPPKPKSKRTPLLVGAGIVTIGIFGWLASMIASGSDGNERDVVRDTLRTTPPPLSQPVAAIDSPKTLEVKPEPPAPRVTAPNSTSGPSVKVTYEPGAGGNDGAAAAAARSAASALTETLRSAGRSNVRIVGQVSVADVTDKNEFGMASATGTASLRAVDAKTGRELARADEQIAGAGTSASMAVSNAVKRAVEKAGSSLLEKLP